MFYFFWSYMELNFVTWVIWMQFNLNANSQNYIDSVRRSSGKDVKNIYFFKRSSFQFSKSKTWFNEGIFMEDAYFFLSRFLRCLWFPERLFISYIFHHTIKIIFGSSAIVLLFCIIYCFCLILIVLLLFLPTQLQLFQEVSLHVFLPGFQLLSVYVLNFSFYFLSNPFFFMYTLTCNGQFHL